MEQLNGVGNAKKAPKQDYSSDIVVESEEVTIYRRGIFSIVKDGGYFVALKNNRVSEVYSTLNEAMEDCDEITWERITQVIVILTGKEDLFKQEQK